MRFSCDSPALLLTLAMAACGGHHPGGPPGPRPPSVELRPALPPATLSGRIIDRDTSLALAGVAVVVQDAAQPRIQATATTGADGSFTLAGLPPSVPVRVVCQPVVGTVAYATEVSAPVTLVRDTPAPSVQLACAQVAHPGRVEGGHAARPGLRRKVALVQEKDLGAGNLLKVLIRVARPEADGSFQFAAVPPGKYEVHFLGHGDRRPHRHRHRHPRHPPRNARVVAITVQAGLATQVSWPAALGAAVEDPEPEADLEGDEAYNLP